MSETGEVAPSSTHTLLVLGAPQCGKSSFIQRIVRDKFSSVEPMGSERVEVQHDTMLEVRKTKKESVPVHIIEASGARDAFRANWKRWFVQSGAVLVLYDASVPFSFEFACKLVSTLVLERESGRPRLPFAFVGTRSDVAANSPSTSVAPQVAAAFAERTGACVHGVVSAKGDKRVALLALVRVLLEQLRPDRVNASMRAVTAKCALVCDTLAKVGDNSADEFVAVLHALRATLARRVDADKLIRDEASFDMLCSALGKQEALLDVYLSKLDKSAKSAKLQRFVSNNKLRRKLEKLSSQLESVRVVIESTIANVRLDEQPEGTIVVGQYAPSAMIASSDQAPPPLATPPDLPQRIDRPPARPAPEPSAAVVADRHAADRHGGVSSPLISSRSAIKSSLERAPSSAAAALASATTSTMARLVQRGVDVGAVIDDDDDARAFWQRSFGDAYQVPFETFVHEFGTVAFAEGSSAEIKPADARVLRGVLDDAETDFVNVYKFAHFARGFAPLRGCLERVVRLVTHRWFVGFLTSDDATRLLAEQPPGTFLVRFSKSRPGSFAIAYVDPNATERVAHARLHSARGGGVVMNKSTFESIDELIRLYQQQGVLTNGLNDSLPREPWFRGDFDDAEATSCLQFTPPGTFLVRFDPARKGYAFVVSFVGADRAIQHVPVHADDKGVFRAFSFGLTSPPENAAKTVRDVVDANALALRVPAPRDDGFAEERALDPFASFDATDEGKRSSLGGFVASGNDLDNDDDDDDDELRGLNVYQPLPGLTKKANPLATSLSKPRHARTPSGENATTVYAYVPGTKPTSPGLTPPVPDKLRRKSNEKPTASGEGNDPMYQVPAMLKPQSMSHVERRGGSAAARDRQAAEPSNNLSDYAGLTEERFSKYMDDSARAIINERKHDVPVLASPTAQLGTALSLPSSSPPPPSLSVSSASTPAVGVPRSPLSPTPLRPRQRTVHDGTIVLDDNGQALVQLPLQFVRECRDFRYFLTPIGRFAALFVSQEVDATTGSFRIAGGSVGSKVCWQVVGDK